MLPLLSNYLPVGEEQVPVASGVTEAKEQQSVRVTFDPCLHLLQSV
jgi:hypothetical protein